MDAIASQSSALDGRALLVLLMGRGGSRWLPATELAASLCYQLLGTVDCLVRTARLTRPLEGAESAAPHC